MHHPLENNAAECAWFISYKHPNGRAGYRRAVELLTGSLPTWAARKPSGEASKIDTAQALHMLACGMTQKQVAGLFGVTADAVSKMVQSQGLRSSRVYRAARSGCGCASPHKRLKAARPAGLCTPPLRNHPATRV